MEILVPIFTFLPLGILIIFLGTKGHQAAERSWLLTLLVVTLVLRMGCATMFATFPQLRVFHEDADGSELVGMAIASHWRGEGPPVPLPDQNYGYLQLSALVYYIFGRFRVNASLFNALLGTGLTLLVYDLAKKLFHEIVARRAALLMALMPSMVLWGAIALKDVPVTFAIVVSLSSCVSLKRKVTVANLMGTLLPLAFIQPIRFYIVYFVAFGIGASLLLDRSLSYLTGIYRQLFILAIFGGLFALLGLTDRAEVDADRYLSLQFLSQYRRGMAITANSGFDADIDISQPAAALAYLPVGIAHLLLAPFPWQMTSLRPLLAAPETIFWWTLFPATIRGIIFSLRNRFSETSPLVVFSVTLTAVYSLMHGNVGAAFRQRTQVLVFLFIFSAMGTYVARARSAGVNPLTLLRPAKQGAA